MAKMHIAMADTWRSISVFGKNAHEGNMFALFLIFIKPFAGLLW